MRAVWHERNGAAEVLRIGAMPDPAAVRVHTAGDASRWLLEFPAVAWREPQSIIPGSGDMANTRCSNRA